MKLTSSKVSKELGLLKYAKIFLHESSLILLKLEHS